MGDSEPLIGNIKVLHKIAALSGTSLREYEAMSLLKRVVAAVTPAMKRRSLRVKKLEEFYPNNHGLQGLNINGGAAIKIRLRFPNDPSLFYEFDHILGTMIHELTHNTVGSHSATFYKSMDELYEEVERDQRNGIIGSSDGSSNFGPFIGSCNKVGGSGVGEKSKSCLAAEAALKRQRAMSGSSSDGSRMTENGGYILGGKSLNKTSRAELRIRIIDAAQQRQRDNLSCPAESNSQQLRLSAADLDDMWECPVCSVMNTKNFSTCSFCFFDGDVMCGMCIQSSCECLLMRRERVDKKRLEDKRLIVQTTGTKAVEEDDDVVFVCEIKHSQVNK